jgi:hypothetical protein
VWHQIPSRLKRQGGLSSPQSQCPSWDKGDTENELHGMWLLRKPEIKTPLNNAC